MRLDARLDASVLVAPSSLGPALSDYRTWVARQRAALTWFGWRPDAVPLDVAAALAAPLTGSVTAVDTWWSLVCGVPSEGPAARALVAAGVPAGAAGCAAPRLRSFPDLVPGQLTEALAACGVDPATVAR